MKKLLLAVAMAFTVSGVAAACPVNTKSAGKKDSQASAKQHHKTKSARHKTVKSEATSAEPARSKDSNKL